MTTAAAPPSTSTSTTSSEPLAGSGRPKRRLPFMTRVAVAVNDFVHLPVVDDLCWYGFWLAQLLLGPLWAVGLVLLFLRDLVRGALVPRFEEPEGRAVLVTGCDTGFGHELALALYEKGWVVYAGCLTAAGVAELTEKAGGAGSSLRAVRMDVTKQTDIDRVVAQVRAEGHPLYCLVNNAGIGRGGVVEWMPMEEYRAIFEVNFFAMVAMTKACLPLLKETKGRVVNMTSFAGLFHGAPIMSAYCASKHASEAFSTSLRLELKGWGIKVVTCNPGFHRTPIQMNGAATLDRAYDALPPTLQEEYGPPYLRACRSISNRAAKSAWSPHNVVGVMLRACTAREPKVQYVVGGDAKFLLHPLLNLPTGFVEELIEWTILRRLVPARVRRERERLQQQQQQAATGVEAADACSAKEKELAAAGGSSAAGPAPVAG